MSPDGGDTSPPTELSAGNGSVALQCADCCAPQTQPRFTSERDSDASASIDAPPLPDNRPPPALASSGVPYLPGASAATDPRSTRDNQQCLEQWEQQDSLLPTARMLTEVRRTTWWRRSWSNLQHPQPRTTQMRR